MPQPNLRTVVLAAALVAAAGATPRRAHAEPNDAPQPTVPTEPMASHSDDVHGAAPGPDAVAEGSALDAQSGEAGPEAEALPPSEDGAVLESPPADEAEAEADGAVWIGTVDASHEGPPQPTPGGAPSTVSEEDLNATGYTDVQAVLPQVAGVFTRTEDAWGLRPNIGIRGAGSDRSRKVTLTEDGILFGPAPYSAPAAYYFPLMGRMTGLDVYKGPSALLFGPHTTGGAVDLRARRPVDAGRAASLELAGGAHGFRRADGYISAASDRFSFLLDAAYLGASGFKDLDGGGPTGFDRGEVLVTGAARTSAARGDHAFELALGWSGERSHETYVGLSDADFEEAPYRRYASTALDLMEWSRVTARASHTWRPYAKDVEVRTTFYRHGLARRWGKLNGFESGPSLYDLLRDPTTGSSRVYYDVLTGAADSDGTGPLLWGMNDRTFVSQGVQVDMTRRSQRGELSCEARAGLRLHYDSIQRDHSELPYDMVAGELVRGEGGRLLRADSLSSTTAGAAWGMWELTWRRLSLAPGARIEGITTRVTDALTADADDLTAARWVALPALGAGFAATETVQLEAGVREGFSPVSPGQPDDVRPERNVTVDGGVRWEGASQTRVAATAYHTRYRNLVGECSFSSGCDARAVDTQFNAGAVRVSGVELEGATRPALSPRLDLPVRAAATFTTSRFQSSFASEDPIFGEVEEGDALPYVPAVQLSGALGVGNERWGVTVLGVWAAAMLEEPAPTSDDDALRSDPSFYLDATASYRIHPTVELFARGDNVTNHQYIASRRPYGARPGKPLSVLGGVRWVPDWGG